MSTNATALAEADYAAQNKGPYILAITWAITALSVIFVSARLWTRIFVHGRLMADDWFVILGQVRRGKPPANTPSPSTD
jgi:hypothetical protein